MISHTHIGITDFDRAFAFYDRVLSALGWVLKFSEPEKAWAGWMVPHQARPLFLIGRPFDGQPHVAGNGQMVALLAPTRAVVDQTYTTALAQGVHSEGAPGLRPQYHANYYGAYFRDLDGNKLCVCCHAEEAVP
ncbi:VOC family protein [Rhodoferax sp. GW822-FHT02A01]|uniref:VOC family protein n=1 Tax=Rhodoferax sp. GW822-FHT02A01 TaxID=3141537 RepID=UPI00315DBD39